MVLKQVNSLTTILKFSKVGLNDYIDITLLLETVPLAKSQLLIHCISVEIIHGMLLTFLIVSIFLGPCVERNPSSFVL